MNNSFPMWIIYLDYLVAIIIWSLLVNFFLSIFISNSKIRFVNFFFNLNSRFLTYSKKIIPSFMPEPLESLFMAWVLFLFRFYILPLFNGTNSVGYLAFPFENMIFNLILEIYIYSGSYFN